VPYVDPQTVLTPKNIVRDVHVIYDSGPSPNSWSVALLDWDGEEAVAMRWNGEEGNGVGNPQSHARPTWFVVPGPMAAVVRARAEELNNSKAGGLLAGYQAMAADQEREAEALEWSEALIADATRQQR